VVTWFIYTEFRECQKNDWKNGVPQSHKLVCGKSFKDDPSYSRNAPVVSNPKFKKVPPPDPSFTRSSALCYQILKLEKEDNPDYVVSNQINKGVLITQADSLLLSVGSTSSIARYRHSYSRFAIRHIVFFLFLPAHDYLRQRRSTVPILTFETTRYA
jgi:hypothetical protein